MSEIHEIGLKNQHMSCKVSSLGATVLGCSYRSKEVIYVFRDIGNGKKRGGIPICFPFFGPSPISFEKYVAQHGWLRDQNFSMWSRFKNIVTFAGLNIPVVPYSWLLMYSVAHVLGERYLETHIQIMRLKDDVSGRAPLNPGLHPYFPKRGNAKVYVGSRTITCFSHNAECIRVKKDDHIIIDTGEVKIRMTLTGFDYETCVYIWSDSDAYFCVEPVLMPMEYFNASKGLFFDQKDLMELCMRLEIV